jgi:hypothetical protein
VRRPISTLLACSFVLLILVPAPAQAWWEYIEGLSGPKLHGPHFEARLFCFMEPRDAPDETLLKEYTPRNSEQKILVVPGVVLPCVKKVDLTKKGEKEFTNFRRAYSFDVGARWHWDNSFPPADTHRVNFISAEMAMTWYPIERPTRDVVDLSGGVGWYWFKSNAFPTFDGFFYDLRADVHVPTVIRRLSKWTVFIPTGRFGMLLFPSGFKANAFADTVDGFRSKRMDGPEKAFYFGYFFDLDALMAKRTRGIFQ